MWPWKRNGSRPVEGSTSILDQGCELEGRFNSIGTLILNGKFRGELLSSDTLLVGETGQLEADTQVGIAIVSGKITGNITARERVELRRTARVFGDIITPVLVLEEGVVFDGRCKMKDGDTQAIQAPKTEA